MNKTKGVCEGGSRLVWVCEGKCGGCEVGFTLVWVGFLADVDTWGKVWAVRNFEHGKKETFVDWANFLFACFWCG